VCQGWIDLPERGTRQARHFSRECVTEIRRTVSSGWSAACSIGFDEHMRRSTTIAVPSGDEDGLAGDPPIELILQRLRSVIESIAHGLDRT